MKVKVNNEWVDVPAFKVGGGNIKCLEGDITLASAQNNILVTHNLGVVPLFAEITITSDYTPASKRIWTEVLFSNPIAGATPYGANLGQENNSVSAVPWSANITNQYYAWFRTDVVRFYSGYSLRLFFAGNYHYKIYYSV